MMRIVCFVMLVLCAWFAGCGELPKPADNPSNVAASEADLRVVSLSPAISRTLVDFGLDDRIVGRTQFCASLDQSIPVVGSLLDLDYERLLKLQPTHVLVQPSLAQGVEPRLREMARSNGWIIGAFPALNTVEDVEAMILKLPELLFVDGCEARNRAAARAAELTSDIARALRPAGEDAFKGSVLLVAGVDPLFVFGAETYLSDILVSLGGSNAAHVSGWAELSFEDVIRLDPEAIVFVRDTPVVKDDVGLALGPLAELPIRAVKEHRLAALVHADANLPSSGVIGVADALRDVLVSFRETGEAK